MRTLPVFAAVMMISASTLATSAPAQDATPGAALIAATKATTRSTANVARDQYRHPAETLAFFGVKPTDTVIEIWPGGGWYTEILAPYLSGKGTLYVAAASEKGMVAVKAKQALQPEAYRTVKYAIFPDGAGATAVPAGTADAVLTFRNVHNWRFGETDKTQAAFDQMFAMLKPGGTLGVEEHRLPEDQVGVEEGKSGYMKQSSVIAYATKAGFKLVAESAINANPKDTHDYPKGVWTLPPTYEEGDADRARYAAIGESDRMTLKFVKPK
ncbi:class I SAM-dependent methyltransferase [Sphingomonas sp. So64.6b]|uniref:class I SAM-dependent methyltransferase n=1 Tax=Sphingomonas sp. So64.6b TaxID=2997354 RepID=UPI0016033ADC|nr:class I SAM-dependent methyltransferase [Sphingomonas sp. So64.6b]QNA82819.1 class I SAM-dependent methyltransferase [Sphingomonas sp. So64.6b]